MIANWYETALSSKNDKSILATLVFSYVAVGLIILAFTIYAKRIIANMPAFETSGLPGYAFGNPNCPTLQQFSNELATVEFR